MPGEYHCLDKDEWKEVIDRKVHVSGNVFVGKKYSEDFEVRVFVRKKGE